MPGTTCAVQKATCSVSAKKLSGIAVQHQPADRHDRHQLLGHDLGRVEHVEGEALGLLLGEDLQPSSYSGYAPASIASHRSRRWKSGSAPEIFTASSHTSECVPAPGVQWNLTKCDSPAGVDQPEGVHAEALHRPVAARDGAVGHRPHQHVR